MKWVTRARPKTDRIACPWLIRRFIDHDADILYVPADQVLEVAAREGGHSFDATNATYTHRGNHCTFEVLIDEHQLGHDPALTRLAQIVHAADIAADLHTHPLGPGLLALGGGGLDVEDDDQRLLERGSFVYDALYAWCQRQPPRQLVQRALMWLVVVVDRQAWSSRSSEAVQLPIPPVSHRGQQ